MLINLLASCRILPLPFASSLKLCKLLLLSVDILSTCDTVVISGDLMLFTSRDNQLVEMAGKSGSRTLRVDILRMGNVVKF